MTYVKKFIALVRKRLTDPASVSVKEIHDAYDFAVYELKLKHLDNLNSVILTLNKH